MPNTKIKTNKPQQLNEQAQKSEAYISLLKTINLDKINNSKTSIDSLRLKIPQHVCSFINPIIDSKKYLVTESDINETDFSTAIEWKGSKTYKHVDLTGVETGYLKYQNNKTRYPYIILMFSSKILGADYIEGITLNTIKTIHKIIESQGIIRLKFEDFIFESFINDFDIKTDIVYNKNKSEKRELAKQTYNLVTDNLKIKGVIGETCKMGGGGAWFGHRSNKPSSFPHFKVYDKILELEKKYKDFLHCYFIEDLEKYRNLKKIVRIEFTCTKITELPKYIREKYKEEKKKHKICHLNLENISEVINSDKLIEALVFNELLGAYYISENFNQWIGRVIDRKKFVINNKITTDQQIINNLLQRCREYDQELRTYKDFVKTGEVRETPPPTIYNDILITDVTDFINDRTAKHRKRKQLKTTIQHQTKFKPKEFEQKQSALIIIEEILKKSTYKL